MADYNACILEIYQNPQQYNRYFCRVTAGQRGFAGIATFVFQPMKVIYDLPLNGPGRNKAESKVRARLKADGLDLIVLKNTENVKILGRN